MNLKSKNPFLTNKSYTNGDTSLYDAAGNPVRIIDYNDTMTVRGTINKTFILFVLLLAGACVPIYMAINGTNYLIATIAGLFIGFAMVIACTFSPKNSRYLAPAYALFEGVFIGGVSLFLEMRYPGIVIQAIAGTFVTFGVCLALYRFGVVKVTEQFRAVVIGATLAIATYYFISLIASWAFGIEMFHHGNSLVSIGFSIFVIIIAALNLFMDFDLIEQGAKRSMPKYMEWYSGMGLVITMVWLYIEFLKLLMKLQSRK